MWDDVDEDPCGGCAACGRGVETPLSTCILQMSTPPGSGAASDAKDRRGVLRGYARTSDEECLARMWVCTIEIDKTQISGGITVLASSTRMGSHDPYTFPLTFTCIYPIYPRHVNSFFPSFNPSALAISLTGPGPYACASARRDSRASPSRLRADAAPCWGCFVQPPTPRLPLPPRRAPPGLGTRA